MLLEASDMTFGTSCLLHKTNKKKKKEAFFPNIKFGSSIGCKIKISTNPTKLTYKNDLQSSKELQKIMLIDQSTCSQLTLNLLTQTSASFFIITCIQFSLVATYKAQRKVVALACKREHISCSLAQTLNT